MLGCFQRTFDTNNLLRIRFEANSSAQVCFIASSRALGDSWYFCRIKLIRNCCDFYTIQKPSPQSPYILLWRLHWIETATNATAVPRQLTAFEDYCGRWRYLKQALVASKGWETLPISLPTWPLARPAPTAIPKCPHFWTVVPLSPQLLLKKNSVSPTPVDITIK